MKLSDFYEARELVEEREDVGQYLYDHENERESGDGVHLRLHTTWYRISGDLADAVAAEISTKRRARAEEIDTRLKELGVEIDMPLIPEDEDEDDLELAEDDAE